MNHLRRTVIATALAVTFCLGAAPRVSAQPIPASPPADAPAVVRNPWIAVGLSAIPLALSVPAMIAGYRGTQVNVLGTTCNAQGQCLVDTQVPAFSLPMPVALGLTAALPMGTAGGYAYAGDPLRGALVGAGGVVLPIVAGLLGFGLDNGLGMSARLGYEKPSGMAPLFATTALLAGATCLGYQAWAVWDVYQTAARASAAPQ